MKEWFSAKELAGISGLSKYPTNVTRQAKREGWANRPMIGVKGGGLEYHINSLPQEIQTEIRTKFAVSVVQSKPKPVVVRAEIDLGSLTTKQREIAINTKRDQTDASGVFVAPLDKWVDSDDKAYQNILGVKASLDLLGDMEIEWIWADNTSSTINRQTLAVIVGSLLQAKQANHTNAIKHKEAVMQTDNPLEYDYSTGWTKTYADYVAEAGNE